MINSLKQQAIGQNLQVITVLIYKEYFILEADRKVTHILTRIKIDRKTQDMEQLDKDFIIPLGFQKKFNFSALLGILPILNKQFLLMVNLCQKVCSIEQKDIYEVKQIALIPFQNEDILIRDNDGNLTDSSLKANEQNIKITKYAEYLKRYYFSFTYELSLCRDSFSKGFPAKKKFLWNLNIVKNFEKINDKHWFIGLIQGSIKNFMINIEGTKIQYFLITRRSWTKGGTRFNSRGIDVKGNVANFCETQQIILINDLCFSHVQIRGSVPVFWKQTGLTGEVQFYKNNEDTKIAFDRHFQKIMKHYQRIFCINLLCKQKDGELDLTVYYENLIKQKNYKDLKYEYFDVHCACKGQKFEKCNYLIDKINGVNQYFGYYKQNTKLKKVLKTQNGIVRVNCLDNLDRTNLIQSKIAYDVLISILARCGFDIEKYIGCKTILLAADNTQTTNLLIIYLKNIWADNGDMISKHYTGTGSTHTNVTRTGKRNILGLIDHGTKTAKRLYQQYFDDNYKQEVIDILIGEHTETINLSQLQEMVKNMDDSEDPEDLSQSLVHPY